MGGLSNFMGKAMAASAASSIKSMADKLKPQPTGMVGGKLGPAQNAPDAPAAKSNNASMVQNASNIASPATVLSKMKFKKSGGLVTTRGQGAVMKKKRGTKKC